MATPARKPATYADLLGLPEQTRAEILAGEIVVAPAPLPRHSKAQGAIRRFVGGPYDDDDGHGGPGGWWIFEVDVALSREDVVRPDVAGWRRARLLQPGSKRPIEIVPDWVCEVLSPATAARDRVQKRALYARAGVGHYWIVDPEARVLEALTLREGNWLEQGVYDESATARIAPFDDVTIDVGRLFLPRDADNP
ncbi:MAG TPA: Uma2 family endonuclease [Polyangiaceae bacterium]|nr:Uma2 family endonuclease [Polyangiaceae bacterium]